MQTSRLHNSFFRNRSLPAYVQSEAAECGIVCLAMIASYWGHQIDVSGIRRQFHVSLRGSTLKDLLSFASSLGLQGRPLRVGLERITDLSLPCVLHWDMNHFVVLKSLKRDTAEIHDPAVGIRRLSLKELSKHFTGVALELVPGPGFAAADERLKFTWRDLLGPVVGIGGGLIRLLILGAVLQACALLGPFYVQWMVDEALMPADRDLVTVLGLGFVALVLMQALVSAIRYWVATTLSASVNFQWLSNTFLHLLQLPSKYFSSRHVGDILSRFSSIQVIQRGMTTQAAEGALDGILALTTMLVMLGYSAKLTAVAILAIAMYVTLRLALFRRLRLANAEQILHASKQHTHLFESIRGIDSIRLFGQSLQRRLSWMNLLADQTNAELRVARITLTQQTSSATILALERIGIVWIGAYAVLDNQLTVGMLFAFLGYQDQFSQRLTSLTNTLFDFAMLRLHAERVAGITLETPEGADLQANLDLSHRSDFGQPPVIELRNVSFRYGHSDPPVLHDISLRFEPGQSVAITGKSGCGKSTLAKLLLGLLNPTSGQILVNGVEIRRFGLSNYRQMIGAVMQDDTLFGGSIAENVSFFDDVADNARIEACCRKANIHREIAAMPMGYHTLIGNLGNSLSGGQRQRILLARALYKSPAVLILDEATSHLDAQNEAFVNDAIRSTHASRIVVAHRSETIASAERVIVLEGGTVSQDSFRSAAQQGKRPANPSPD